ncbi:MAG TPA: ABC transporter ATP-binding protein [Limnochordales bacterium]
MDAGQDWPAPPALGLPSVAFRGAATAAALCAGPAARCVDVTRHFGPVRAVDGATLTLRRGQLTVLVGPSGCGKTTLLRLIAGFEVPDRGRVEIGGVTVAEPGRCVPPERRGVGVVFQDFALFPHLTVAENVAFGLRPGPGRAEQVARWLRRVGLTGLEGRYPHQLSGGQQQRVALARALAPRPQLLLLDEPFGSLDPALRVRLRREVRQIVVEEGVSALLVTHDPQEALSVADLVAVMVAGRILQVGPPETVYDQPISPEVAALLGEVNLLAGSGRQQVAHTAIGPVPLRRPVPPGRVVVMLRPEWLGVQPDPSGPAEVVDREYDGAFQLLSVAVRQPAPGAERDGEGDGGEALQPGDGLLRVRCPALPAIHPGERVRLLVGRPGVAWAAAGLARQCAMPEPGWPAPMVRTATRTSSGS